MISVIERLHAMARHVDAVAGFRGATQPRSTGVSGAINVIRANPKAAPDVNAMAKEAGLSRAHFYRLFERSTRMTPHLYVNLPRMELAVEACRSIATRAWPSSVIRSALQLQSHFTRFFRDHSGVNPSEFPAGRPSGLGVFRLQALSISDETSSAKSE